VKVLDRVFVVTSLLPLTRRSDQKQKGKRKEKNHLKKKGRKRGGGDRAFPLFGLCLERLLAGGERKGGKKKEKNLEEEKEGGRRGR